MATGEEESGTGSSVPHRGSGSRICTEAHRDRTIRWQLMLNPPLSIRAHSKDNVAIVVNEGGLPAGSQFAWGLTLLEAVPEAHKIALADLAVGDAIVRYGE